MPFEAFHAIEINVPSDWDVLLAGIPESYAPKEVVDQLKSGLDAKCARIIVELYYNDKDYRSTYYNFYAKKGFRYEATCIRLHFFDRQVTLQDYELKVDPKSTAKLNELYFGYMVLRPTLSNTIGRTVLTPSAITGFHGSVIEADHKVHLLGHRLAVKGFPYMSQHSDISVCAHAACWSILRHNSERFSRYAEYLTFDITRMAQEFDPGGLLPSTGLHVGHAERIFASAGTYPMVIIKSESDPGLFWRQLFAYVESGFPLFAEIDCIAHAVAIIGHTGSGNTPKVNAPCNFASDLIDGLVVVDDNNLPYWKVPKPEPVPKTETAPKTEAVPKTESERYNCDHFSAFIVPLPDKVYYSAESVDGLAMLLANDPVLGFDHESLGSPIVRYFLTTAASLRRFVNEHRSQFDPELIAAVMQLSLPQFIWIIEIASQEQRKNGQIETRAIVDATARARERFPIFLMHDRTRAYVRDRGGDQEHLFLTLNSPDAPLSSMPGNLITH